MVLPARNPSQVNRMLGGSPPGAPPANAFDMDPNELDRMLSEGWTMYEDGTLAPPATPGGMNLGPGAPAAPPPTMAPSLAPPAAAMAAAPPAGPGLGGPPPLNPPVMAAPPVPAGPTPPGVAPIEPSPPPPDLGGVSSPLPGTPPVSTGVGPDLGPSLGLGLDRGHPADYFADTGVNDVATPALDPFAYMKEQNRASAAPGINQDTTDPNGYTGADVAHSDPRNLLPRRRRQQTQGPALRLNMPDPGLSHIRRPMPQRRP
jgi:hypothetical protein